MTGPEIRPTDGEVFDRLQAFAATLTDTFSSPLEAQEEEQLKRPVQDLLEACGPRLVFGSTSTKAEAPVEAVGRPDIAVAVNDLLCGYVELKAPGTGANANKFKGRNKQQWEKFKTLPNLVYTDGNEWALYRSGDRHGKVIVLSGDVTEDGDEAVQEEGTRPAPLPRKLRR